MVFTVMGMTGCECAHRKVNGCNILGYQSHLLAKLFDRYEHSGLRVLVIAGDLARSRGHDAEQKLAHLSEKLNTAGPSLMFDIVTSIGGNAHFALVAFLWEHPELIPALVMEYRAMYDPHSPVGELCIFLDDTACAGVYPHLKEALSAEAARGRTLIISIMDLESGSPVMVDLTDFARKAPTGAFEKCLPAILQASSIGVGSRPGIRIDGISMASAAIAMDPVERIFAVVADTADRKPAEQPTLDSATIVVFPKVDQRLGPFLQNDGHSSTEIAMRQIMTASTQRLASTLHRLVAAVDMPAPDAHGN
jgi:hypothetical protein